MKKKILNAALAEFLTHGMRDTSIQKLADILGISTKTFYKFFKNKQQILEEAIDIWLGNQYKKLSQWPDAQNAVCRLFDICFSMAYTYFNANPVFFHDVNYYFPALAEKMDVTNNQILGNELTRIIKTGMKEGTIRPDIIPDVALKGIFVLHNAITREEAFRNLGFSVNILLLNTLNIFIKGICTNDGLRILDEYIAVSDYR